MTRASSRSTARRRRRCRARRTNGPRACARSTTTRTTRRRSGGSKRRAGRPTAASSRSDDRDAARSVGRQAPRVPRRPRRARRQVRRSRAALQGRQITVAGLSQHRSPDRRGREAAVIPRRAATLKSRPTRVALHSDTRYGVTVLRRATLEGRRGQGLTMNLRRAMVLALTATVAIGSGGGLLHAQSPSLTPDVYKQLKFRYIGPAGNRVIAVAGVPGDPNIYYAGAASGGICKIDRRRCALGSGLRRAAGRRRSARSRSRRRTRTSSGSAPARRSSAATSRSATASTSRPTRGKTWTHVGPREDRPHRPRRRSTRAIPTSSSPCALGTGYGPQPERGVFRTTDGGKTWERMLFVDENTGCSDLAMDANEPAHPLRRHVADRHQDVGPQERRPRQRPLQSLDGGATWKRLDRTRPARTRRSARSSSQIARSNPNRVYALIETGDGLPALDGGRRAARSGAPTTAARTGSSSAPTASLHGRTHYYTRMPSMPDNANEVYFLSAEFSKTLDGGGRRIDLIGPAGPAATTTTCGSTRPTRDRMMVGNDDGAEHLDDARHAAGTTMQLPIAQMYHVATDNRIPYNVYGNRQDGAVDARPEQQPLAKQSDDETPARSRAACGLRRPAARPAGRRPIRSTRTSSGRPAGFGSLGGIVERFDARTGRRATWRSGRSARWAPPPAEVKLPLQLDVPDRDLAARPQHRLRRQPVRPRDDRRRPDAGRRSART